MMRRRAMGFVVGIWISSCASLSPGLAQTQGEIDNPVNPMWLRSVSPLVDKLRPDVDKGRIMRVLGDPRTSDEERERIAQQLQAIEAAQLKGLKGDDRTMARSVATGAALGSLVGGLAARSFLPGWISILCGAAGGMIVGTTVGGLMQGGGFFSHPASQGERQALLESLDSIERSIQLRADARPLQWRQNADPLADLPRTPGGGR